MIDTGPASAQSDITIAADPARVYDLITDLSTLASLAEEAGSMRWRTGDAARPGAVFRGRNRNGIHRWSTTCTVTDAEPGRVFAFDVHYLGLPIARWRYDINDIDEGDISAHVSDNAGSGCRVTERTWDRRPGWFTKTAWIGTGVRDRDTANAEHIKLTLQRLKEKAEAR